MISGYIESIKVQVGFIVYFVVQLTLSTGNKVIGNYY